MADYYADSTAITSAQTRIAYDDNALCEICGYAECECDDHEIIKKHKIEKGEWK